MGTRVLILVDVDDEYADPSHEMGITEEANLLVADGLPFGEIIDGPVKVSADSIDKVLSR